METKHILALNLLVALTSAGLIATLFWQRARDAALFLMVFGAVFVRKFMDVSFAGEYWYRGTIRGIEVTALDIAAWCVLAATLLAPRYPGKRWYWPAGVGVMTLYFLYCSWSVATSEPQLFGLWELTRIFRGLVILLVAALFIRTPRELAIVVVAMGCAVWFMGLNAIEQRVWKGVLRPPATLDHENSFSMYLCTVAPVLLAATFSNWSPWLRLFAGSSCAIAALAEVMTLSRAGIPIFAFVMAGTAICCVSWRLTWRKVQVALACLFITGAMVLAFWNQLNARYAQGMIKEEFIGEGGFETRGEYWRLASAIAEDMPYGVGLNNWSYHVSKTYAGRLGIRYNDYDDIRDDPAKAEMYEVANYSPPAHSLAVITWGELGMAGLIVFGLVWLRWFQMGASFLRGRLNPDPMHRMAIGFLFGTAGIFLQSVTEWTYRQTPILFTFHIMMGALASLYYARRQRRAAERAPVAVEEPEEVEIEAAPVQSRG
jgi:hypothetical protein